MKRIIGTVLVAELAVLIYLYGFKFDDRHQEGLTWLITPAIIYGVSLLTLVPLMALSKPMAQFRGKEDPKFNNAPIGIGTLREVRRTGLSINDVYQYNLTFEVVTPEGHTFTSTAKQFVPEYELASMVNGLQLPVCYLPGQPERVVIAPASRMHEAQQAINDIGIRMGVTDPDAALIESQGMSTTAVVVGSQPTGEVRAGRTAMQLTVRVQRPDGSYFDTAKICYIPPNMVGKVQIGSQVEVTYLPYDETRFVIAIPLG